MICGNVNRDEYYIFRNYWGNTIFEFAYSSDTKGVTRCVVIVGEGI